jgi:capsular polysaccharide biosynthesis protein
MSSPNYTSVLIDQWKSIGAFCLVGLVLALVISFIQPLKYSSTVRLLVLQDVGSSVDAYTASRSEERIAENLSTIVYTTTFFDEVMTSGFSIDGQYFPTQDAKRRREWSHTVDATVARGSGLLTITAYHRDVVQAEQLARAVSYVLTQKVGEYTSGDNVQVKLIDAPLNSRWPVRPNIPANAVSGFVLGGLIGAGFVLMGFENHRRKHQLIHEEEV